MIGSGNESSSVDVSGTIQHVITPNEIDSFSIGDANLKNAVGINFGKNPTDAWLHSPTATKEDLYEQYNWEQVQTVLTVVSGTITGIISNPEIVSQQVLENQSEDRGEFKADISQSVSNTLESNWMNSNSIDVSQSISYQFNIAGSEVGGETSLSYSHTWGQGGSDSKTVTLGSEEGVSVQLDPGQSVLAELTATRGVMNIRIVYEAHLIGGVAIHYRKKFQGHYYWLLPVDEVMQSGGIQNSIEIVEDIQLGYFTNSKVALHNQK